MTDTKDSKTENMDQILQEIRQSVRDGLNNEQPNVLTPQAAPQAPNQALPQGLQEQQTAHPTPPPNVEAPANAGDSLLELVQTVTQDADAAMELVDAFTQAESPLDLGMPTLDQSTDTPQNTEQNINGEDSGMQQDTQPLPEPVSDEASPNNTEQPSTQTTRQNLPFPNANAPDPAGGDAPTAEGDGIETSKPEDTKDTPPAVSIPNPPKLRLKTSSPRVVAAKLPAQLDTQTGDQADTTDSKQESEGTQGIIAEQSVQTPENKPKKTPVAPPRIQIKRNSKPKSAPVASPPLQEAAQTPVGGNMLSTQGLESSQQAFDRLKRAVRVDDRPVTLEDIIRQMLDPMLKSWVDDNLPKIINERIDQEIARITQQQS
ncbi:MAG: DUF2497 domain-containing protein [Pseudomonadota bacterium]